MNLDGLCTQLAAFIPASAEQDAPPRQWIIVMGDGPIITRSSCSFILYGQDGDRYGNNHFRVYETACEDRTTGPLTSLWLTCRDGRLIISRHNRFRYEWSFRRSDTGEPLKKIAAAHLLRLHPSNDTHVKVDGLADYRVA